MPLKKTEYGGICPLGKFEIDIAAGAGCYTSDPVEACLKCLLADTSVEKFDLEKIWQWPPGMTREEYRKLREQYASQEGEKSRTGFQEFVRSKREES